MSAKSFFFPYNFASPGCVGYKEGTLVEYRLDKPPGERFNLKACVRNDADVRECELSLLGVGSMVRELKVSETILTELILELIHKHTKAILIAQQMARVGELASKLS